MKLGIVGLSGSGKSTIFEALTHQLSGQPNKKESRIGTVRVPDDRIDRLSELYRPKKTIHAQVEYYLPGTGGIAQETKKEQSIWTQARDCHALIHVIRNFKAFGQEAATPLKDFRHLDQELILIDLVVVEKRLEKLQNDSKRGKNPDPTEIVLLTDCLDCLVKRNSLAKGTRDCLVATAPGIRVSFCKTHADPVQQ